MLVGFVALRPKSTAMVIAGRSVHLTTLSKECEYVLKRVSFGSKECTKELKLECAYYRVRTMKSFCCIMYEV